MSSPEPVYKSRWHEASGTCHGGSPGDATLKDSLTFIDGVAVPDYERNLRHDRVAILRVKIKTLAWEAKEIRRAAKRHDCRHWGPLNHHNITVVRPEARHALLAYAYLRDRPRCAAEGTLRPGNAPDFKRFKGLVKRFSEAEHRHPANPKQIAMEEDMDFWWKNS